MESGMRRTTRSQSRIQQQSTGAEVEVGAVKKKVVGKGDSATKQQPRRALADVTNSESSPLATKQQPKRALADVTDVESSPLAALSPAEAVVVAQCKPVEDERVQTCQLNSFDPVIPVMVDDPEDVTTDDDERSSNWSVAVNVSSPIRRNHEDSEESEVEETDQEEEEEEEEEAEEEEEEEEEEEVRAKDDFESELCKSMKNVTLNQPAAGKHFRYKYRSDDEEEFEIEEVRNPTPPPPALKLAGLPTPAGKHLRFNQEEGQGQI